MQERLAIGLMSQDKFRDYVMGLRQTMGLGQEEFAKKCKLSSGWIGRLETGTLVGAPKLDTLKKIAIGARRPIAEVLEAAGVPSKDWVFVDPALNPVSEEAREILDDLQRMTPAQLRLAKAMLRTIKEEAP